MRETKVSRDSVIRIVPPAEGAAKKVAQNQSGFFGRVETLLERILIKLGRDPIAKVARSARPPSAPIIKSEPVNPRSIPKRKPQNSDVNLSRIEVVEPSAEPAQSQAKARPEKPIENLEKVTRKSVDNIEGSVKKASLEKATSEPEKIVNGRNSKGQFVGGKSKAQEAQEEQKKKKEDEKSGWLKEGLEKLATGTTSAADSDVTEGVGNATAGADFVAAKELFDGAREIKTGLSGFSGIVKDTYERFVESKLGKAITNKLIKPFSKKVIGPIRSVSSKGIKRLKTSISTPFKQLSGGFKQGFNASSSLEDPAAKTPEKIASDQASEKIKSDKKQTKQIVKAIEDNAGQGGSEGSLLDDIGSFASGGGKGKGMLSGFGKVLGKLAKATPLLGAAIAGFTTFSEVKDREDLSTGQKAAQVSGSSGGTLAGALAGGKLGALLGSVVPVLGTAVGGALGAAAGGLAGYFGGDYLGKKISDWMGESEPEKASVSDAEKTSYNSASSRKRGRKNASEKTKTDDGMAIDKVALAPVDKIGPVSLAKPVRTKSISRTAQQASRREETKQAKEREGALAPQIDSKSITDPIVKAIKESNKNDSTASAYDAENIPTDFSDSVLRQVSKGAI